MKKDIHPDDYRSVLFYDSGAGCGRVIRSCAQTQGKTMQWEDGETYPVFMLDTSSASHPVYTGKQRVHNAEGRAGRFDKQFASALSVLKKG